MRSLLVLALLLLTAAPARADGFAPADPVPPADAHCVAAAGDVIAIGRSVREGWVIEASVAGGPWERVLGAPLRGDVGGCPTVAAADDGTAVVAGGNPIARIAVRPPGGSFGPASELGRSYYDVAVAAARGGSVVAAWTQQSNASLRGTLTALVATPGRPVSKRVLSRGQSIRGPRAVIAPDGTATVAWDQSDTFPGKRYAEFRAGSWGESVEMPDDSGFSGEHAELDLAATPSGRRLLAWVAVDGIRALVDGSPPVLIVPTTDSASVAAAIAEDGTAVVAYSDTQNRLLAVDRTPDGSWSAPRVVGPDGEANVPFDRTLTDARFSASVAPNGTPIVAWPLGERVAAVAGRGRPALLSPPTRNVYDRFHLDGDRVLWVEPDGTVEPGRLRGARLASETPADTTAPRVTLSSPKRAPNTSTGEFVIPVTARCDEVCDVRVERESGDHTVRRLAAGERSTVRHVMSASVHDLGVHTERFVITVSDRAGNTLTRRASIRVRVVDAPVRSFKVSLDHDFWMLDAAGNRAVARFVNRTIDRLARGRYRTRRVYSRAFTVGLDRVARRHPEAVDIEVRDAIDRVLYPASVRAGL